MQKTHILNANGGSSGSAIKLEISLIVEAIGSCRSLAIIEDNGPRQAMYLWTPRVVRPCQSYDEEDLGWSATVRFVEYSGVELGVRGSILRRRDLAKRHLGGHHRFG
ncbi:hypothetical protein ACFXTH_022142 [Malus domestica]